MQVQVLPRSQLVIELGVFQSGQMGLTVNQVLNCFGGSNPPAPTNYKLTNKFGSIKKEYQRLNE